MLRLGIVILATQLRRRGGMGVIWINELSCVETRVWVKTGVPLTRTGLTDLWRSARSGLKVLGPPAEARRRSWPDLPRE